MAKSSLFSNTHNQKMLYFFGMLPDFRKQENSCGYYLFRKQHALRPWILLVRL